MPNSRTSQVEMKKKTGRKAKKGVQASIEALPHYDDAVAKTEGPKDDRGVVSDKSRRKAFAVYEEKRIEREAKEDAEVEENRPPTPIPMDLELELSYRRHRGLPLPDMTNSTSALTRAVKEHEAAKKFIVAGSEPNIFVTQGHGKDDEKKELEYFIRVYDRVMAAFPLLHDAYFKDPSLKEVEKYPGFLGVVRVKELPYNPLQTVLLWARKDVDGEIGLNVNIGIEFTAYKEEELKKIVNFAKKYEMEGLLPHVEYARAKHADAELNPR